MLTVYYHHYGDNYDKADLWVWDETGRLPKAAGAIKPTELTEFGCVFHIPPGRFGGDMESVEIGFIVRPGGDWESRDGDERSWRPAEAARIWLVADDPAVYTSRPDISPRVSSAWVDGPRRVLVHLSHPVSISGAEAGDFRLRSAGGAFYTADHVRPLDGVDGRARLFEVHTGGDLDIGHQLMALFSDFHPGEARPREILQDRGRYFSDLPLGAVYTKEQTTFRVFAPAARGVEAVLYDNPAGPEGREAHPMTPAGGGVWEVTVGGDLHLRPYVLSIGGREVVDIHSRCNSDFDGRGRVLDLRRTDPPGFRPIGRPANIQGPTDAVIWEVHLRDLTIHESSGVEESKRGRYTGAATRGTHIPESRIRTCIDHMVELGVTHVQLLPVQDFDNHEEEAAYDWGYMPVNFSSPDGWYATNPRDESRVRELKELVAAFHGAGLRVVLDVVYNHTAPAAAFERIVPGYYHRRTLEGAYWNGSGCGNEFRSEAPMARKFIVDSCRYWAGEYGFDGFRFDLMGLVDFETLCAVRDALHAIDPSLLIYGEPWAAAGPDGVGLGRITDKWVVAGSGIGAFNDHFRNAIKGPPNGAEPGFVQAGLHREAVMSGIMGSINDWARDPSDAIQYVSCHDNLTLWDKMEESAPDASTEERMKMHLLALGILAVSQGVLFLHGGVEFARTKFGHHNSYNASDHVNRIDWRRKRRWASIFEYTKGVVHMRRAHPVFRLPTREEVEARLAFRDDLCPGGPTIAFTLDGRGLEGEAWEEALVLINGDGHDGEFTLPPGNWRVYTYALSSEESTMGVFSGAASVPARTLVVLGR